MEFSRIRPLSCTPLAIAAALALIGCSQKQEAKPAAAPAPKADAASEGERTTAVDGEQPASVAPVSATPIAARGFAWSNISAAQGIGEPKVSNAAWSIADIHERSMGQMKRLALAAVPPKTAP